jgi:CheY-like chemotaxis protein
VQLLRYSEPPGISDLPSVHETRSAQVAIVAVIVVAEDNHDLRMAMTLMLERAGHEVIGVESGEPALEALRANQVELVVTDLDMPGMDGLALCKAVRSDPELRETPVIIATGGILPWDGRVAEAQACGVLVKPFLMADLIARIQEAVTRGRHLHEPARVCELVSGNW